MSDKSTRTPNRLASQRSPYLLQHANNPVDWHPWSDEAFEKARELDRPVFLSIGYSTCHWCHVMEEESFENERIAKLMNDNFISIKVDREERPDLDSVYMNAVQMMTGSGGWPLSVFLTPDGKPFYGGTYWPAHDIPGRRGFDDILEKIAYAWKNSRSDLLDSAQSVMNAFHEQIPTTASLSLDIVHQGAGQLAEAFDRHFGGLGAAPKFPQPVLFLFLLNYWYRTGQTQYIEMAEITCDAMAAGGIRDHLGGGFHRYTTDQHWLLPHFEKMLYDQALIATLYVRLFQITGAQRHGDVANEIFTYVLRDMTDRSGGFYSGQDADSDGAEGKFYIWNRQEIIDVIGLEHGRIFSDYYNVSLNGNFENGKSVLHVTSSIEELSRKYSKSTDEIKNIIGESKGKLFAGRALRPKPFKDDKIITAWNALMISSLAIGSTVLQDNSLIAAAIDCADFIQGKLVVNDRLMRYYRLGQPCEKAFLEDYSFLIAALIDLYESTFEGRWLVDACRLAEDMIRLFSDESRGGFFLVGNNSPSPLVREKPCYDGVVPSGNSAAVLSLLRLYHLTTRSTFRQHAARTLDYFAGHLQQAPTAMSQMLSALDLSIGPAVEIAVAGGKTISGTPDMLEILKKSFIPNAVILFRDVQEPDKTAESEIPVLKDYDVIDGKSAAYLCQNYTCREPVTDIDSLVDLLEQAQNDYRSV